MYPRRVATDTRDVTRPESLTFLFTDIVGSTKLWEADSTGMSASLRIHDALLRSVIESSGGNVFGNPGDAFCAAFPSDAAAVAAARAIQSGIGRADWGSGPPIAVRVGLHRGEAERRGDNLFGPTVNLCARVCDSGHGGQILLTESVSVEATDVTSCGLHRLKGVSQVVRLLQLGEGRFPPLRTVEGTASNIPVQINDLIGRDRELDELSSLLTKSRLVTLIGPGGVGKTRLAIALADRERNEFSDGVWFAELASARDMSTVLSAVADSLRLPTAASAEALAEQIRGHDLLLVLDNCEHVIEHVSELAEALLRNTRRLHILATSRELIAVQGEYQKRLGPLAAVTDACALFTQRALQVGVVIGPDEVQLVEGICQQLDGVPLALELAAAATRTMGVAELVGHLDRRLDVLLAHGRSRLPQRHHSLRAAIDWSYESLSETQKTFFRRISVFNGGFPLGAATRMAVGLDASAVHLVGDLVDRSLLSVQSRGGRTRYLLLETIRQYAYEMLEHDGDVEAVTEMHATWCIELAHDLAGKAFGSAEAACIAQMIEESGNFRRAIAMLLDSGQGERAGDLVLAFEDFSYAANVLAELVLPLMKAGVVDSHPQRRRLLAIELIRRATSDGTEGRAELAAELADSLHLDDPGSMQIVVLLIANALSQGKYGDYMAALRKRALALDDPIERARLKTAAMLGYSYGDGLPNPEADVSEVLAAVTLAGMKRLLIPTGSMTCLASLSFGNTRAAAQATQPILKHLAVLPALSIMSSGLVTMYTEAAVRAGLPTAERLAAVRHLDPVLQGDFNRIGLALARLVQCEGNDALAVRAVGACVSASRSEFSRTQRSTILELAAEHLSPGKVERLLADGAASERSDLYREMWGVLGPLID
jgi:predicted ATPase/class 3 adenylate cyclase